MTTTTVHTVPSRDFTRDVGSAKRMAAEGPVFITDRGTPAYVLLRIEDYYKLAGHQEESLLDVMDRIRGAEGIDFDPPRIDIRLRPIDLE